MNCVSVNFQIKRFSAFFQGENKNNFKDNMQYGKYDGLFHLVA